jgi:hypothetical protein
MSAPLHIGECDIITPAEFLVNRNERLEKHLPRASCAGNADPDSPQ